METTLAKACLEHDFPLKSQAQSFFIPNGIIHPDIEMVAFQSLTYTSLRDLLPPTATATAIMSPMYSQGDSWREIPMKDPLLQHAAWAYLRPIATAREADDRSCAAKLRDGCLGLFGCFGGFFDDVVSTTVKGMFWEDDENVDEDEDEDEDDDDI